MPEAKRWPDEQESHMRRPYWVRRRMSSKPNACRKSTDVDVAGISVKVARFAVGDVAGISGRDFAKHESCEGWSLIFVPS
jgi:hypothetical protein